MSPSHDAGYRGDDTASSALPVTVTTVEDFEEGYVPDDDASSRLNAYIAFACRDSQNNPGPADTQPAPPPPSSTLPVTGRRSTTVRGHVPRCIRREQP